MVLLSHFFVLYSVPFLLLLLKLLLSTSMFAAQWLLWKPIFHHFVPHYLFFLKSHGYDGIQTSNEFLLIFTLNTTYTPNIFTGEWVNSQKQWIVHVLHQLLTPTLKTSTQYQHSTTDRYSMHQFMTVAKVKELASYKKNTCL